ncbi:four-carbon acid sugar kinase family protein [Fusibacter sp. 3D3]|uniref:four-carbon acid sugar kinase family protein n=1 Tax=Fusibacter sp. 3D3 TaxID=1048380 RepID=UPI000853071B|nr:four-carbon acid sugar kinase family protein [Fusibacter sp. 3D3]GAU76471.1 domain of unknown function DUF1537 [Fusibacter sp. 3D3]
MVKLLIIADDFTGALDTAVQFASCGAITRVVMDADYTFENMDQAIEVLVINAETRHLQSDQAYEVVYKIVDRACKHEIAYLFKKTDSALRGNIGSELTAMLEAAKGSHLHFIPALPRLNRITKKGIHYIDDVLVHQSVFGKDPFEPVTNSSVSEMISMQSQMPVNVVENVDQIVPKGEPSIIVYDAETDKALQEIAEKLYKRDELHLMAGCAGFASVLPKILNLSGKVKPISKNKSRFLVVCGSVNPITRAQLDYAEQKGFHRIRLSAEQKLSEGYLETEQGKRAFESWKAICFNNPKCIIDSNDVLDETRTLDYAIQNNIALDEVRLRITKTLGRVAKMLVSEGLESTIMLTGGDTLLGFMNQVQISEITPLYEIEPGTVLSNIQIKEKQYEILSKSGGFGDEQLLVNLAQTLIEEIKEAAV